ncbi:MAG: hypothetical protein HND55_07950 [Pseudomonadota bacterium]|nr:MAG: hypothetical protein HND55_07950 [Pseudomonadota bacterium]
MTGLPERVGDARLFLIRHGQARLGHDDYDQLSALGRRQARQLGERLAAVLGGPCVLWTGTHRRHRQTASTLAPGFRARIEACLDEFQTHALVRAALAQSDVLAEDPPARHQLARPEQHLQTLLNWFPTVLAAWQSERLQVAGGSTWRSFHARVQTPLEDWQRDLAAGRNIIVVTSAGVISTLVAALCGRELDWQRRLAVQLYNASVSTLRRCTSGWEAEGVNCIKHLHGTRLRTLA